MLKVNLQKLQPIQFALLQVVRWFQLLLAQLLLVLHLNGNLQLRLDSAQLHHTNFTSMMAKEVILSILTHKTLVVDLILINTLPISIRLPQERHSDSN